jgi:hypothetical protein
MAQCSIGLPSAFSAVICVQRWLNLAAGSATKNVFPPRPDFTEASFDAAA